MVIVLLQGNVRIQKKKNQHITFPYSNRKIVKTEEQSIAQIYTTTHSLNLTEILLQICRC
jgi:hypothetical protein